MPYKDGRSVEVQVGVLARMQPGDHEPRERDDHHDGHDRWINCAAFRDVFPPVRPSARPPVRPPAAAGGERESSGAARLS
jgi:hypothetical protein